MPKVPETLINFEVYDGESNRQLGLANVELPELTFMTTEINGTGMAGKIEAPILGHFESFEIKLVWRTIFDKPLKFMEQRSVMISLRGAMQDYDSALGTLKVTPVRIDARVQPKGLTLGKLEPGEQTETENLFACDYLKITVDDKMMLEFDLFNYVYRTGVLDQLADVRAALGL